MNTTKFLKPAPPRYDNKPPTGANYTVRSGDTLWSIAKKLSNKGGENWFELYKENIGIISQIPNIIQVGGADFDEYGGSKCCEDDCVEVIRERIEAKIFPVSTMPYGNLAFGENLTNGCADEPRPFIRLYLNDQNYFVIGRLPMKKCYPPKRLIKVTEVITREPKSYETIDRDVLKVPYGHDRKFRSHDYFVENGCGFGNKHW